MKVYYNEFDKKKCGALRALIEDGFIPHGDVDERSIVNVQSSDLKGYTQCHFFAGLGLWAYALHRAGWSSNRSVWTGSCPCQPYSSAGNKAAQSDERHLWPHWFRLIRESKPTEIFGEQVDDAVAAGWLDDAFHDLETEDYACASAVLPACSVTSPHPRDRVWFVANANSNRKWGMSEKETNQTRETQEKVGKRERFWLLNSGDSLVENPECIGSPQQGRCSLGTSQTENRKANSSFYASETGSYEWLAGPDGKHRPIKPGVRLLVDGYPERMGLLHSAGDAIHPEVAAEFIKAYGGCLA